MTEDRFFIVSGSAILAISLALTAVGKVASCHFRWPDRDTRYSVFAGCMVKTFDGYVPEDRIWFDEGIR